MSLMHNGKRLLSVLYYSEMYNFDAVLKILDVTKLDVFLI